MGYVSQMRGIINTVADILMLGILLIAAVLSIYTAITVYPLSPYWIELLSDYSGGFVRRFLLGEILNNIPGVPPDVAGLILLSVCYVFVAVSLYTGVRRVCLPLFLRILVLLSPLGLAFYLLTPVVADSFLLRDILIIALVIIAAKTAGFIQRRKNIPGQMLVCDTAVGVIITFGMLCHSGILFCAPPLLVLFLGIAGSFRKGLIHAAALGVIFLSEFLLINIVFGELEPEGILGILDMFKSKYPGIPMKISPYSLMFSLFNVSIGGESYWIGKAMGHLLSLDICLAVFVSALVPCLILLCRFIRSGLGLHEYFFRNRLMIACSLSALSPALMCVFATDFLRWLTWGSILSVYFAMQRTDVTEKQKPSKLNMKSCLAGCVMTVAALALVSFYTPTLPNGSFGEKSNFDMTVMTAKRYARLSEFEKDSSYVITNRNWNWGWTIDPAADLDSTENKLRIRDFSEKDIENHTLSALESDCDANFLSMSLSGKRLYVIGWEALVGQDGKNGASYVKPAHGMGFLLKHGEDMVFYPTMPLTMIMKVNGNEQKIPFAFDDYILLKRAWGGEELTIYPAFLNSKNKVFYCRAKGKAVMLPNPAVQMQ